MPPYIVENPAWKTIVKDKHLLFDTDAVISILSFDAVALLNDLKKQGCTFTYIHPVYLELMRTNSPKEKLQRTRLLNDYGFSMLPLTVNEVDKAKQVQDSMPVNVAPSPTDLYLAGTLARFSSHEGMLLLTSNLSDFPHPLFTRKIYLQLQNTRNVKVVSFLKFEPEESN